MTVDVGPLPPAETGNRPPKAVPKERKRQEALARREILAPVRSTLTAASVVVAVASLGAVLPFVLIVEACRELLAATPDTGRVWRLLGLGGRYADFWNERSRASGWRPQRAAG